MITDDDERFYTDRRHLAIGSEPLEGARLLFLAEAPADGPDSNAVAAAAVVLGDKLEGRVAAIDLIEGYAFIEVRDRAASLDWVPEHTPVEQQRHEARALAKFALDHWALRGVRAIGEGTLALRLSEEREMSLNPAESAQAIAAMREILKARPDYAVAEANSITPRSVAKVLAEIELALRALADSEERGSPGERDAIAKAAEHLGYALAHAFRGGIVTSLPPETTEALSATHSASA